MHLCVKSPRAPSHGTDVNRVKSQAFYGAFFFLDPSLQHREHSAREEMFFSSNTWASWPVRLIVGRQNVGAVIRDVV